MPKGTENLPQLHQGMPAQVWGTTSPPNVPPVPHRIPRAHPHCSGGFSIHPSPCMGISMCDTRVQGCVCPREVGVHSLCRGPGGALLRGAISQPVLMQFSNQNNFVDEYLSRALNI